MAKDIKGVFDEFAPKFEMNPVTGNRIRQYTTQFVTRNDDHVNFFGSGLLGVYPIRWFPKDKAWWWDDILRASESTVEKELHRLPTINSDFIVASDATNLSYIYAVHRTYANPKLAEKQKIMIASAILRIMHFKFMSSIFAYYFKFPADKRVSEATYASLSKKFALKVYGSWGELINKRVSDILSPMGIHRQAYMTMRNDEDVIYMVTDIQSRIREVIKAMMPVFYRIHESNSGFTTTSSVIEIDGVSVVKDQNRSLTKYTRYILSIVSDKENFIRGDLVNVIVDAMHTMSPKMFTTSLEYLSKHSDQPEYQKLITETLIHGFEYIRQHRLSTNDVGLIINRIRLVYMASRSSNPSLMEMKEIGTKLVNTAVNRKSNVDPSSERTGIFLYILLRTLAMKHYSQSIAP